MREYNSEFNDISQWDLSIDSLISLFCVDQSTASGLNTISNAEAHNILTSIISLSDST